jgi:23S rRNA-/tRNA-specific pseudouridylate synthase
VKLATVWHAARVLATIVYADERLVAINKPAGVRLEDQRWGVLYPARSHSQPAAIARVARVTGTPTAAC